MHALAACKACALGRPGELQKDSGNVARFALSAA